MNLIAENGLFVCAERGGGVDGHRGDALVANRQEAHDWENFELMQHADGTVSLRCANGMFVSAEGGGGGKVSTNRETRGPWESFRIVGGMFQCADKKHYLRVRTDLATPVVDATGTLQGLTFQVVGLGAPTGPGPGAGARKGVVRLDGRAFVDDSGQYLAVGTTLFWALWGYRNDRPKLEKHLDYLAAHAVEYIRVFGIIGPPWNDRLLDPRDPQWEQDLAGLLDLAYSRGLRVELTIWQDTKHTRTAADRRAAVDRIAAVVATRPQTIQYFEIANEGYGADRFPAGWPEEAQQLANRLREKTPHLVAVTSPGTLEPADIATWYGRSTANLLTVHLPREAVGGGVVGDWRYVRQTWDPWLASNLAWTNDEGKGPQSSVAEDADPVRLTMYAALTWLCGGAGFVLHTGAGVSGAGERGRVKNVWEVANIEQTLAGIAATRKLLPTDLPNWSRHNTNNRFPHYPYDTTPITPLVERGDLVRAFAATNGDRLIVMPIGVQTSVPFKAKRAQHLKVYDPMTGQQREERRIAAGESFTLAPTAAAVMVGTAG